MIKPKKQQQQGIEYAGENKSVKYLWLNMHIFNLKMSQQWGKVHLKLSSSAHAILLLVYRQPQTVVIISWKCSEIILKL